MEWKRLGDYVKIRTGKLDANASSENGKYPFFTCSVTPLKINEFAYDCECVLIAGNGDLNVKYYEGKFNAYQRTYIVESADKLILKVKYLYYFMSKYVERLRLGSIGGVIKYIKLGDLTEAKIPLPPLKTQQKIVHVLDKAQSLINKRKEQTELMDELIQSTFYEMFGDPVVNPKSWEKDSLQSLIVDVTNGLSRRGSFNASDGKIVLRLRDIGYNKIKLSDINQIELKDNEIEKYRTEYGDLLFIRVNGNKEYVGRCAVNTYQDRELYFNDHIMRVRLDKSINPIFIAYFLNSGPGKREILKQIKTSAGQYTISQAGLSKVTTTIPPIELQNQFAEIVEKIEVQKQLLEQSLAEMENNYNSLMQRAFKGEIM